MCVCMGQYMYINTYIHICIFIFIHTCIYVLYLFIYAYGALTDGALTDGALTDIFSLDLNIVQCLDLMKIDILTFSFILAL